MTKRSSSSAFAFIGEIIEIAQKEAFNRGNPEVGLEHLTFGTVQWIMDISGDAEKARAMGLDIEGSSSAIDRRYPRGQSDILLSDMPFNPEALEFLHRAGLRWHD